MRRLALIPAVLAIGLLAGCSQVAQFAGDAVGVDVDQVCTSFDDAYAQYEGLLDQGDATADQVASTRDDLVATLKGLADDIGGKPGDLIRSNAQKLAESVDPTSPESIEAIEQIKTSLDPFCD
ncbi:hypothetical protein [Microbacterium sp. H1-D42]|uniref:hypothetical protein n=1 Tax=Microbacterium sp. H1-D42 TaxID=2925844 RepID=UPI001F53C675|nr:hypothetical protein [Microbacterium sp. H1-D42]UNK69839.1 hypothetical protein MNR00_11745 [Microbacterium sp. H1-D42]